MTVLSRQSIIKYMQRKKDPLEIYTTDENGEKCCIPDSQINSHTVNLCIGTKVGELDLLKLQDELKEVFPLDRIEFIYMGGINPYKQREAIEKSLRILNLSKLGDYSIEKEGQGDKGCYSWIVRTTDKPGYTFSTRITKDKEKDKKAKGIILHPEIFNLNLKNTKNMDIAACIQDGFEDITKYFSTLEKGLKNRKKLDIKELERKRTEVELLSMVLKDKIFFERRSLPSTSFSIVWTNEYVHLPNDLTARIETKSRIARLGVSSHPSSGKVDAGFNNQLALEFKNVGDLPVVLNIGDAVAELQFEKLDKPTELGYSQRKNALYKKDKIIF